MTNSSIFKNAETKFLKLSGLATGFLRNLKIQLMSRWLHCTTRAHRCFHWLPRCLFSWRKHTHARVHTHAQQNLKNTQSEPNLSTLLLKSMTEAFVKYVYGRHFPPSECLWNYLKHSIKCYLEGLLASHVWTFSPASCKLLGGKNVFYHCCVTLVATVILVKNELKLVTQGSYFFWKGALVPNQHKVRILLCRKITWFLHSHFSVCRWAI